VPIHYEKEGHVVTVTIDRPEARNSLDLEHFGRLADCWVRFRDDDDAYVAILTGVGDVYCVGADLKKFVSIVTERADKLAAGESTQVMEGENYTMAHSLIAVLRDGAMLPDGSEFALYKPVIAAVNGVCVAGGMEMLGSTDIRVAVPEARFAVMEPKRGLFAGGGTTVRLPRQIPYPLAMELLLTADMVDAERALAMGLLNRVVPAAQLMATAYDYAERIAANAPLAVFATKQSAVEGLTLDLEAAFANESRHSDRVFATEDAKEGPRAFAEKRPPVWQAR